jgi:uncharacterized membrane protein (TIGR02234 family)
MGWVPACAAGTGLTLLAAGRDWMSVSFDGGAGVALAGTRLAPVLMPLALAAGASALAVLATRGIWRKVVGAILTLCGAGVVVGALTGTAAEVAMEALRDEHSFATAGRVVTATAWFWPGATVVGGLILAGAGVVAVLRGGRWAGMSDRYDRPAARKGGPGGGRAGSALGERALWDAIDSGADPTVEDARNT